MLVSARVAAQAMETRARAWQEVAVAQDAGDGGIGGSRLRPEGLSEGWGGEETN